jgi:hypothetical protein
MTFTKGRAVLRRGRLLEEDVRSQGANGDEPLAACRAECAENEVVSKLDIHDYGDLCEFPAIKGTGNL